MLGFETRKSETLLNVEKLAAPFAYKLDILEGGERKVCVIWRDVTGWKAADFKADAEFVKQEKLAGDADEVFVNADGVIPGARVLDGVFKERMFALVSVQEARASAFAPGATADKEVRGELPAEAGTPTGRVKVRVPPSLSAVALAKAECGSGFGGFSRRDCAR
jgi:hypothetical protein